jgi:acetolactate synthase small subunit
MRDVSISLTHRPGELARVARALARYGLNLKSVAGMAIDGRVEIRLLPDEIEPARKALEASGIRFEESEVVTVLLENKAGELADVAEKLAEAKINLQALYVTGLEDGMIEIAIVSDDPKKAKRVLD